MINLLEIIKNNRVKFDSYREGFFYYNIELGEGYGRTVAQFTIPVEDTKGATMLAEDKAITYMRWIRKAIEDNTLIQIKNDKREL